MTVFVVKIQLPNYLFSILSVSRNCDKTYPPTSKLKITEMTRPTTSAGAVDVAVIPSALIATVPSFNSLKFYENFVCFY